MSGAVRRDDGARARACVWMLFAFGFWSASAVGHEGHAPIPTKGATIQGKQLLLSEAARRVIGVASAKVVLADLEQTVRAQAQVQLPWHQQALVTTLIPGRIERVLVGPGDRVVAGQPLALVEGLDFETMQRDWLRALADEALAQKLLAHHEGLVQGDAIPMVEALEARRDAAEASARVEVALRKLLALGLTEAELEKVRLAGVPARSLPIVSPISGELVHADVRAGQVVSTNEHLFHVVDLSEVEVACEVLESDLSRVGLGQPVEATISGLVGQSFAGRVEHTHLGVDSDTRTLTVIAHVANPGLQLRPGMSGGAQIRTGSVEQAIVAPSEALSGTPGSPFVLLERAAGRYEQRAVRPGMRAGNRVEILDGLFPGDRVVVTGTAILAGLFPTGGQRLPREPKEMAREGSENGLVLTQARVELPTGRRHFASSQVEGRIARILVNPGDVVEAGQVLAEVESLPLRNLQLELLKTETRLRWARDTVERLRILATSQAAARVDLWRAEGDLEVTQQTIAELRAKLEMLGLDDESLERLERGGLEGPERGAALAMTIPIRAPASGRLDHFSVVPGQVVGPTGPGRSAESAQVFEIQNLDRMWICAFVGELQADSIRAGDPVSVSIPALPGVSLRGVIERISPVVEGTARVLPVWVEVENPGGKLFEGMQAEAVIAGSGSKSRVASRVVGGR